MDCCTVGLRTLRAWQGHWRTGEARAAEDENVKHGHRAGEGLAEGVAEEPLYPDQPEAVEGEGGEEPLDPVEEEADDPEGEEAAHVR